jgi:hypothetical protein
MTGMTVRLPAALENPTLYVQKGGSLAMTLDVALINEVLGDMGHPELTIPESLDGDQVRVTVPNNVIALYGDCPKPTEDEAAAMAEKAKQGDVPAEMPDCVAFMQMPSPTVEAPVDLNVGQLGQVYLELMGMEPEKAAEFSKTIDWTNTFVLPMPSNFANYQTKMVDGVEATFIRTFRDGGRGYMLLWVKDGVLYSLTGPGGGDTALDIADSIK